MKREEEKDDEEEEEEKEEEEEEKQEEDERQDEDMKNGEALVRARPRDIPYPPQLRVRERVLGGALRSHGALAASGI
eukprot:2545254-Pyramimonas_sp.AAC.1